MIPLEGGTAFSLLEKRGVPDFEQGINRVLTRFIIPAVEQGSARFQDTRSLPQPISPARNKVINMSGDQGVECTIFKR